MLTKKYPIAFIAIQRIVLISSAVSPSLRPSVVKSMIRIPLMSDATCATTAISSPTVIAEKMYARKRRRHTYDPKTNPSPFGTRQGSSPARGGMRHSCRDSAAPSIGASVAAALAESTSAAGASSPFISTELSVASSLAAPCSSDCSEASLLLGDGTGSFAGIGSSRRTISGPPVAKLSSHGSQEREGAVAGSTSAIACAS